MDIYFGGLPLNLLLQMTWHVRTNLKSLFCSIWYSWQETAMLSELGSLGFIWNHGELSYSDVLSVLFDEKVVQWGKKKSVSRKWFISKRPYGEKSSPLFLPHFVLKRLPCSWGGFQQWLECVSLFTCCISFFQELRERERPVWWGSDLWDQRTAGCGASCVGCGAASLASTYWVPAAPSPQVVTTQNIFVVKGPYESGLALRTTVALTQSSFISCPNLLAGKFSGFVKKEEGRKWVLERWL